MLYIKTYNHISEKNNKTLLMQTYNIYGAILMSERVRISKFDEDSLKVQTFQNQEIKLTKNGENNYVNEIYNEHNQDNYKQIIKFI